MDRQRPRTVNQVPVTLRTEVRPGDIGTIVRMHGVIYAKEYGFDRTFEAYVAGPLADFVRAGPEGGRAWIAEQGSEFAGCIAIVRCTPAVAQLRWFLVTPECRGLGLGTGLMTEALSYCRSMRYGSVFLWTVSALTTAAHLYRAAGFRKVESRPGRLWGVDVVEERYELKLVSGEVLPI